jgi:ABC-2 type transport system ATP-binding protein
MKDVTKFFGNFRALNNISMNVEKGEVLGLLGPNGAGKTTAMRILTSFLPANSGKVTIAGFDVFEDSMEVRRRLGYLPETPPLYNEMTVYSYLNFVGEIKELPKKRRVERINEIAERIGLDVNLHRVIGHLSKGFRQRVGIAQALLHNPEVLILDEPTVGLDPNQIIEIRNLVKDLARDHTIILSTHYLAEVSMTCNRVVIINEGEIVAKDSVANLESKTAGKPLWTLVLKTDSAQNLQSCIKDFNNARLEVESESDGLITCELELPDRSDFDSFFGKLTEKKVIFREIVPVHASLEQVFLKLTSGEERKSDE